MRKHRYIDKGARLFLERPAGPLYLCAVSSVYAFASPLISIDPWNKSDPSRVPRGVSTAGPVPHNPLPHGSESGPASCWSCAVYERSRQLSEPQLGAHQISPAQLLCQAMIPRGGGS